MAINVLIASHIFLMAEGIRSLLESSSKIEVAGIVCPPPGAEKYGYAWA